MPHPLMGVHAQLDRQHVPLLHRLEDRPVAIGRTSGPSPVRPASSRLRYIER